ncbi:MAG: glycosyl hydrolase family 28-related protein [Polyangiaceae bacterium]|nr:glycosyl hydrolase family 28-related protein [Polyangiaceae bacterium]
MSRLRHQLPLIVATLALFSACLGLHRSRNAGSDLKNIKAKPFIQKVTPGSRYPDAAGLVDVKLHYGAKGDGVTDDTARIQQALSDYPNAKAIIYLPAGTYLISDTLKWPKGRGNGDEYKQTTLEGESREKSILKLKDNASGFRNQRLPKSLIWMGPAPAQRFGNSIRSLTVDTGRGNGGAIGMQFHASNQGVLFDVTIRSGDDLGVTGLDMDFTNEIGPLLVKNVAIVGFQNGIVTGKPINGQVLESVALRGQKAYGILDSGQALSIRKLTSENTVPAIHSTGGFLTLLDSTLMGTSNATANVPAVYASGDILVRGLTTSGYSRALEAKAANAPAGAVVAGFCSVPRQRLFSDGQRAFPLPIEETPEAIWDPPGEWANVQDFGAVPGDGQPDDEAFQRAIDSGKTTVFLSNAPNAEGKRGSYTLSGTVLIRGNVRRLLGTESSIYGGKEGRGTLKLVDGAADTVVIERIGTGFPGARLEMKTERTLVLKNSQIAGYTGEGGRVFFEDVSGGPWDVWRTKHQKIWARQFNPEVWPENSLGKGPHLINDGGTLWIFGFKTEQGARTTVIETINGGRTEILGGHLYTYTGSKGNARPMFVTRNSALSVFAREALIADERYQVYVEESRQGAVRRLEHAEMWPGAFGGRAISYLGLGPE